MTDHMVGTAVLPGCKTENEGTAAVAAAAAAVGGTEAWGVNVAPIR